MNTNPKKLSSEQLSRIRDNLKRHGKSHSSDWLRLLVHIAAQDEELKQFKEQYLVQLDIQASAENERDKLQRSNEELREALRQIKTDVVDENVESICETALSLSPTTSDFVVLRKGGLEKLAEIEGRPFLEYMHYQFPATVGHVPLMDYYTRLQQLISE